ncbi:MAG: hypothetical protein DSM106950_06510 [Stigonema ocellatum SAG 48.90 = DSM 106950]|nr:hypothetical protein [Stigonema ocellatum SAG 48.90 = DSM 106950]
MKVTRQELVKNSAVSLLKSIIFDIFLIKMTKKQPSKNIPWQQIKAFIKVIGIPDFSEIEALEIALMHPSYIYELNGNRQIQDLQEKLYWRQAHLGRDILCAIVTEYLYEKFPNYTKDELAQVKQLIIDNFQLSEFAIKLKLKQFCLLEESQKTKPLDEQEKLMAEMFEAVFCAIYLGLKRDFCKTKFWLIERFIADAVNDILTD